MSADYVNLVKQFTDEIRECEAAIAAVQSSHTEGYGDYLKDEALQELEHQLETKKALLILALKGI